MKAYAIKAVGMAWQRFQRNAKTQSSGSTHLFEVLQVLPCSIVIRERVVIHVRQSLVRLQERDERNTLRLEKLVQKRADYAHLDVGHGATLDLNVSAQHGKLPLTTLRLLMRGRDDAEACLSLVCLQPMLASEDMVT